jgi:hypothetical protein
MARERDDDNTDEPRRRRRDEPDDEPRRRRRDEDDEGYAEAPRARRRRDDDEEDEPRPRRRPRDDDDDYGDRPRRRPKQLTGLDATFANTNVVLLILFACLCNGIALILGVVGLIVCKDPTARQNALITTIIGAILTVVGVGVQVVALMSK